MESTVKRRAERNLPTSGPTDEVGPITLVGTDEASRRAATTGSVLNILDSTKNNKSWFNSRGLVAGYHTMSIGGETFQGQRDSGKRVAKIPYDFAGKRVLDIGCSNGGLLHHLAGKIGFGVGVDFNSKCINGANAVKAANGISNVHFYSFDLDKEDLSLLDSFVFGSRVDICFILNISLWVKRWKSVVSRCAALSDAMVFESHGTEDQQALQIGFVRSIYGDVELVSEQSDDDPTYVNRTMYLCRNQISPSFPARESTAATVVVKGDEGSIRAAYDICFGGGLVESVEIFPHTQESIVAEINSEYIVKFPRASRGAEGLAIEQRITDFVRDRVSVPVPKMTLHGQPMLLARYPKLPGAVFNKALYGRLGDKQKDALADQIAGFMRAMHTVSEQACLAASLNYLPSWQLSPELIEEQLGTSEHPVIRKLVAEVVRNHRNVVVPTSNMVLGHFDLHGGNMLFDAQQRTLTGVIDFGNTKRGDLHQDFSSLCLSSPDLADRVIDAYERRSDRKVNRLMVQHYATAFYLNLLAGLLRGGRKDKYDSWLRQMESWYDHLLADRARARLRDVKPLTSVPANWRRWVAQSLMKGIEPAGLQKVLREKGFPDHEVALELANAASHPFIEAGKEVFHLLQKRDWLLRTCDTLHALDPRYGQTVERREVPSFDVFVAQYYSRHLPVVLSGAIDHWPARKRWTPEYFAARCGDAVVEVQTGRANDPLYERNAGRHKTKMTMAEFVHRVKEAGSSNDFYMTANNTKASLPGLGALFEDLGDIADGYRTGNAANGGQYLWFGPKGTFTPLHHDLTNNMLVQISGRKKVTLVPALQVASLYNDAGVFSAVTTYPEFDAAKHPLMREARKVEVVIGPGDALFIPVGWWHCVESLDVSISTSFTDFKANNQFAVDFPR